jgi:hypothetical protein
MFAFGDLFLIYAFIALVRGGYIHKSQGISAQNSFKIALQWPVNAATWLYSKFPEKQHG